MKIICMTNVGDIHQTDTVAAPATIFLKPLLSALPTWHNTNHKCEQQPNHHHPTWFSVCIL